MSFVGKIKYCTLEPYVLEQYWNRMQQFIVWCIVANALLLPYCHKPRHMIILFPFLKKVLRHFYLWRSKGRNAFNQMKNFTIQTAFWKTCLNKAIVYFMINCKSKLDGPKVQNFQKWPKIIKLTFGLLKLKVCRNEISWSVLFEGEHPSSSLISNLIFGLDQIQQYFLYRIDYTV